MGVGKVLEEVLERVCVERRRVGGETNCPPTRK